MSSEYSKEPRQFFLNLLIARFFFIEDMIAETGYNPDIKRRMVALILSLDKESKNQLKKLLERLESNREGKNLEMFDELSSFLHKTYFSELSLGIVPAASLPSEHVKPSKEKFSPELSPRI